MKMTNVSSVLPILVARMIEKGYHRQIPLEDLKEGLTGQLHEDWYHEIAGEVSIQHARHDGHTTTVRPEGNGYIQVGEGEYLPTEVSNEYFGLYSYVSNGTDENGEPVYMDNPHVTEIVRAYVAELEKEA